jgi:hypothetical protein
MDPVDRRQLPLTTSAWGILLAFVRPVLSGAFRAVLSKRVGTGDVFNVTFLASIWAWSIMDLVWGDDRVTHDANDPKLSKWADLQLQIVSFLATLFLLGPAWPWLVLGFKTILVLVVWKIIVRTFSRLINVCPPWIQTAYARSVALYSVCYQILLNSALRGSVGPTTCW